MQATIQYIKQELSGLYPKTEIRAFTRLILERVCGLTYTEQLLRKEQLLDDSHVQHIREIVERLKAYEPVQYILGETEFLDLRLRVNPSVLIPRPETEELVYWAAQTPFPQKAVMLDVGTGSGCIALGLKKMIPDAMLHGCDSSTSAIETAKENAALNSLDVSFFEADILKWKQYKWGDFNLIISNPPYVRAFEKEQMEQNVLQYEPESALFVSNHDPLKFFRVITEFACEHLQKDGWLFFEINEALGAEMMTLVKEYGFNDVEVRTDLSDKDRMLRCRRR